MGWESRACRNDASKRVAGGERRYYYQATKINGKVIKQYRGCDEIAQEAATLDEYIRMRRYIENAVIRHEREAAEVAVAGLRAYFDEIGDIVGDVLKALGYHRPGRGIWRKKRMEAEATALSAASSSCGDSVPIARRRSPNIVEITLGIHSKKQHDVLKRAQSGDESVTSELHSVLDELSDPGKAVPDVLAFGFQLTQRFLARFEVATQSGGEAAIDFLLHECLRREVAQIYFDAGGGPENSALERLLAERVAMCWLHVQWAEKGFQDSLSKPGAPKSKDIWQKRIDSSQRRYVAAIKAIAQVRRLQLPAFEIHINNAGGTERAGARSATLVSPQMVGASR